ncbi:aromatic ring-hydroxylating dioxygenase subunit alpha [Hyphococcus luteus]|uniref:aromatic ring-hydroxylating dioxygenase subunit alpha n=1 Tax=Hyphococcus luteus TaxID=2058213 RepID=UPI001A9C85F9|nr:aromatic ring-hydroxylating dioxygenase subunit alpha [Marinicaulis flavus]
MTFLKNCWYAAAYSSEVEDKPFGRMLLGAPVAIYRKTDGSPAALHDRCPHRCAPLSRGAAHGDNIECPYHGLKFSPDGACVYNPHYDEIPRAAQVRSFPAIEKYGFIWIWPGAPENADESLLPDFGFLTRSDYSTVSGYLRVEANYQLIVDNLLDLSHAAYLHPDFVVPGMSTEARLRGTEAELVRDERSITAKRIRRAQPPNGPTRNIFGFDDERMDSRSHMQWFPPSLLNFDLGAVRTGEPEETGLCIPAVHAITPETETTSHYFFAQARNVKLDDPKVDEALLNMLDTAFRTQDEPMIEAQQQVLLTSDSNEELDRLLLRTDAAPIAVRRMLSKLIAEEQSSAD